ncbi:hypothetical protein [Synoicihabitans lomoniglobus]|uniref:PEP-CTERM protein-sorting domain-containing protein n=1 Tax=Synoicihabitans lomoniglobus TaxID=2909285 RepID=A0AAF0A0Z2_9BACT|nr:hypothetical protein [Opitutaceae bacterium LMO-M01]WED64612.1 hypothetical protein PXH66_19900 [Opitutaceae bacterium LMO-M01]
MSHSARALALLLWMGVIAEAQTATQVRMVSYGDESGGVMNIDTTGRSVDDVNLFDTKTRDVDGGIEVATATNQTSWDINPAEGSIQLTSQSHYQGWNGSGVGLDTRVGLANYDTFTVNTGASGLADGTPVKFLLALEIDAAAQTDGLKFQTATNTLKYTIQQNHPLAPGQAVELFYLQYNVTVYEFFERLYVENVLQFENTTPYENGQGDEAHNYMFGLEIDAVVGETIELAMMIGDLNPASYNYDAVNLAEGTRQNIGDSQKNYGDQFSTTFTWDVEEVAGFEGLEISAASGFAPSINASAVPEPSSSAALLGFVVLGRCLRRPGKRSA